MVLTQDLLDRLADFLDLRPSAPTTLYGKQIRDWRLPTAPAKRSSHSKGFRGGTVEAEAILVHMTRRLLRDAIERHLNLKEVAVMEAAEESERDWLVEIAEAMDARE